MGTISELGMARFRPICPVLLALIANSAYGGSSLSESASKASTSLMFKIVVPHVLIVDTRSGIVYTNDTRGAFAFGATTSETLPRGSAQVSKLRSVTSGKRVAVREGQLVALP